MSDKIEQIANELKTAKEHINAELKQDKPESVMSTLNSARIYTGKALECIDWIIRYKEN